MNKLTKAMQARHDGPWEFLATAAGHEGALRKCLHGLSTEALALGFDGPSTSPSIVQNRVNSLAALDQKLLTDVCSTWREPDKVALDLADEIADFWSAGWSSALRFLRAHNLHPPMKLSKLPRMIRLEHEVLWPPSPPKLRTIEELIEFGTDDSHGYDDYRTLDTSDVPVEGEVEPRDLIRLFGGTSQPHDTVLERLRILIPRSRLVGDEASSWLTQLLRSRWLALRSAPPTTGGLLTLLNLVMMTNRDPRLFEELEEHFIDTLQQTESPITWAPFGYLLLQQGWQVP